MSDFLDTICAPATVAGAGAISIIRISGSKALKTADEIAAPKKGLLSDTAPYTLRFCSFHDGEKTLDEGLAAIFRAPASYTGEDSVELYCHASSFIVSRLLEALQSKGCRLAAPGEFTQRAYLNGKMDLSQAEAVADVIGATTEVEHRVALNQMKGGYSCELRRLRDRLLELSALLELELDFSEEEVEFADRSKLRALTNQARKHCTVLADSFRLGNALKSGVPVAIVGAPNSGKSTLLNALVGEDRAIVTDIPGTTRDTIEESCIIDGVRFRFIDTAGIRDSSDLVERLGIERTFAEMGKADIIIGVVDGSEADAREQADDIRRRAEKWQKLIIVLNKTDKFIEERSGDPGLETTAYSADSEIGECTISISAKNGYGIDSLKGAITSCIGTHGDGDTLVTNARHAAALRAAADALGQVLAGLDSGTPGDLLAEDLRAAINSLSGIIGEAITANEVLREIFGRFCIGK